MCTCRASGGYSGCTFTIIFGGRTCPPTRMGPFGLTEGGGGTGLAAVFSTPPITPPSTPPICPPGTPPGTPPATPPKLSGSRGASLISRSEERRVGKECRHWWRRDDGREERIV